MKRLIVPTLFAFVLLAPSATGATTVEGRFEILHVHLAGGETRDVPQLVVGSKRYELDGKEVDRATPGATLRVTGSIEDGRIKADSLEQVAAAEQPSGGVTTSVLAILVHDSSGPDDVTPELVEQQLEGFDSRWFAEVSKGHVAGLTADATEWLSIPGWECGRDLFSAQHAAVDAGYDLSGYDRYFVYSPYSPNCFGVLGTSTIGGAELWVNGKEAFENGTVLHELGHNYGVWHANALECKVNDVSVALGPDRSCTHIEYGDRHDVMGSSSYTFGPFSWTGNSGHFGAFNLDELGWLAGRVVTAPALGGKYDIAPIEQTGPGLQAVRLNDGERTYWIYYRQPIGVDAFLSQTPGATDGVEIQIENTGSTEGSHVLDMTPDRDFSDVALKSGLTWTTPNEAFRIQVTAVGRKAASIRIKPAGECKTPGWQTLMRSSGERFTSEGACTAYVAKGGILLPFTGCLIRNDSSGTITTSGLQAAHDAASGGDTLTLQGTCRGADLGKDLTITGTSEYAGYTAPTLKPSQGALVVLFNRAGAEITLESLKVTGAPGGQGAGILNTAAMTLNNVVVSGNSGWVGGGIMNTREVGSAASLTLNNSTVSGNLAQPINPDPTVDPYGGRGGGIYNAGDLTLNDSTVTGNTAGRTGGGVFNDEAQGGAPATTLTLNGTSAVTGNSPDDIVWGTL